MADSERGQREAVVRRQPGGGRGAPSRAAGSSGDERRPPRDTQESPEQQLPQRRLRRRVRFCTVRVAIGAEGVVAVKNISTPTATHTLGGATSTAGRRATAAPGRWPAAGMEG